MGTQIMVTRFRRVSQGSGHMKHGRSVIKPRLDALACVACSDA